MAWIELFIASLFEIAWAVGITFTEGFTKVWPSIGVVVATILSFAFLARALRCIALGTAYAVWSGIGAAGTAILGVILLHEPLTLARVISLLAIIIGVLGLKFLHEPERPSGRTPSQRPGRTREQAKVEPN